MTDQPKATSGLPKLWQRLRERKLVQWLVVYAAGAWLAVQIADTIGPRWGLTEAMARGLDVVLTLGFFATAIIAWYHGEKGRQRVGTVELLMLGALLVIGGAALELVQHNDVVAPGESAGPLSETDTVAGDRGPGHRMTIAVLPFDNYSPNPDDSYFAAGITEEITSQLAKIGDLTVLSRVAVERAVQSGDSLEAIAASLGAGSVLEGSVRMAGNQVRITAQLIDMSNHQHLWAENYDRKLEDIFGIQTEVALAIGGALLAELSSGERSRIEKTPTENVRAYQLYLRSLRLLGNVLEENREAIDLLEQALELDPGFALARARLAWRYVWLYRLLGQRELALTAEQIALRALEDDPNLAFGHYALGSAYRALDRYEPTIAAYERAYELDPNEKSVLTDGSQVESAHGSLVQALEMAFRAVQLDPNSANTRWHAAFPLLDFGDEQRLEEWLNLAAADGLRMHRLSITRAQLAMMRGDSSRAMELLEATRVEFADHPEALLWSEALMVVLGRWSSVQDEILATAKASPEVLATWMTMPRSYRTLAAFILTESGRRDEAMDLFEESRAANEVILARGDTFYTRWVEEAAIHAYLGEADEALADLEHAITVGYHADWALRIDPMFAGMRDDPRFTAFLERMADYKRQKRLEAQRAGAFEDYDRLIRSGRR